jgi:hypothetical protein
MSDTSNSLEAIKLINDWGKWLVTIETAAITIIDALFTADRSASGLVKVFGTLTIGSFLVPIAAAAILLLTLPEIAQNLRADQNIWLTRDSAAGELLRMNTQGLLWLSLSSSGAGLYCWWR